MQGRNRHGPCVQASRPARTYYPSELASVSRRVGNSAVPRFSLFLPACTLPCTVQSMFPLSRVLIQPRALREASETWSPSKCECLSRALLGEECDDDTTPLMDMLVHAVTVFGPPTSNCLACFVLRSRYLYIRRPTCRWMMLETELYSRSDGRRASAASDW
jgi:hypothetical protein